MWPTRVIQQCSGHWDQKVEVHTTHPHLGCPSRWRRRRLSQADWMPPPRFRRAWTGPSHVGCSMCTVCLCCSLHTPSPARTTWRPPRQKDMWDSRRERMARGREREQIQRIGSDRKKKERRKGEIECKFLEPKALQWTPFYISFSEHNGNKDFFFSSVKQTLV